MENVYQKLDRYRVLETERLLLRPVTLADAEEMYAYASDEENVRWTFAANQSLEETKNIIASIYLAHPLGRWGIELKETGQFIGTIDMHHLKEDVGRAEFGYTLDKHFWNQGYMTEAARVFATLFFEKFDMNCLIARHDKENPASGRVMQKIGMRFSHEDPYAKLDKKVPNRVITMMHYTLTKEDYFKEIDSIVNEL
ncbi:GNAT family N-acetyltransferase [Streptococcus pluranimalium]|uniref:GNAT family N-acetyltransferase n=1 Tax=Streptococcus pluranimalium TaxID=82348 RepID=UPI0039FDD936